MAQGGALTGHVAGCAAGGCGSCWAFSATGGLEGAFAIARKLLHSPLSFSEQQLLDCAHNGSCKGSNMAHAWNWNKQHGGSCTEARVNPRRL